MSNVKRHNQQAIDGFGDRLGRVRTHARMTRSELAQAAGVHYDTILKLEQSQRAPNFSLMCKLATAMRLEVDSLVDPTKDPRHVPK